MGPLSANRRIVSLPAPLLACALVLASAAAGKGALAQDRQPASANLERCVTYSTQIERYVTFAGRMIALPGSTEMAMRIDVEERLPGQDGFHLLEDAGGPRLGVWRTSEQGVKIFKDFKQVSNLQAPAAYRAQISFRWTAKGTDGARDVVIKRETLRTAACRQPPLPERQLGA
jgi:hypothetical protein